MLRINSEETNRQRKILLYNREKHVLEKELLYGGGFKDFFYGTWPGRIVTSLFLIRKLFSYFYGFWYNRKRSRKKIPAFIKKYKINIEEAELPVTAYKTFNAFFTRRLKPVARPINKTPNILISPADSRLFALQIINGSIINIKGLNYRIEELIYDKTLINTYLGGYCLIFRLVPADCHRFFYIDDGVQQSVVTIKGHYHISVPQDLVLKYFPLYHKNYREYCLLKTVNFGDVLQVEVGAMSVGKIKQHKPKGGQIKRGEEKGYFEFGASTIILLFRSGYIEIDKDISDCSARGIETLVKYGFSIGQKR